jgi:hypothetical protein
MHNPGEGRWLLFYLDVLALAARLTERPAFVDSRGRKYDWFNEGAEYLVKVQNRFTGTWQTGDTGAVVGTSFALNFLLQGRVGD